MKKVTFGPQSTVSIDNITNDSHIGLQWNDSKGMIVRQENHSFIPVNLTDAAIWCASNVGSSKKDCLLQINARHNLAIFEFPSAESLLNWASE